MKKLICAALLFASTQSHAWWSLNGQVNVNSRQASFSAYNHTMHNVRCRGYVYGQTQFGETSRHAIRGVFGPGAVIGGYVYAYGNRVLVNAWADVECETI